MHLAFRARAGPYPGPPRGGGGPGGLLTPGPVVKHGARATRLVFYFIFNVWLMFCFDHSAGAIKLYTFRAELNV